MHVSIEDYVFEQNKIIRPGNLASLTPLAQTQTSKQSLLLGEGYKAIKMATGFIATSCSMFHPPYLISPGLYMAQLPLNGKSANVYLEQMR